MHSRPNSNQTVIFYFLNQAVTLKLWGAGSWGSRLHPLTYPQTAKLKTSIRNQPPQTCILKLSVHQPALQFVLPLSDTIFAVSNSVCKDRLGSTHWNQSISEGNTATSLDIAVFETMNPPPFLFVTTGILICESFYDRLESMYASLRDTRYYHFTYTLIAVTV